VAVGCTWFYLRNYLGWVRPETYQLIELQIIACLVPALHLGRALLRRRWSQWRHWTRAAWDRAALYGAFSFLLGWALWDISSALDTRTFDAMNHAFIARIYGRYGTHYSHFNGNQPILYPAGFGAMNAITTKLAPLFAAQAVNLQHVFLLIVALLL